MTYHPFHQLNLFEHVLETYARADGEPLSNAQLYREVAERAGLSSSTMTAQTPVGVTRKPHNLAKRAIRWHQQTLKAMQVLERTAERGIWRLADRTKKGLHEARPDVQLIAFSTKLGAAVWGNCQTVLAGLDMPITLTVCSPPYLLRKARRYGNPASEQEYIDFLCRALEPCIRHLAPGGSICLNLSNDVFEPGLPSRSMYCERLLLALNSRFNLMLMDRLVWSNPSKIPGPIQWASKARTQLNVAWEPIYWLTNDPTRVRADNRRVLEAHTQRHLALIHSGGEARDATYGDGAYTLRQGSFSKPTPGRIPRNVLVRGHRCADSNQYRRDATALQLPVHGAMQPLSIPEFLIRLLTVEGELVVDPFGGTAKTGMAAERLGRRWLVVEKMLDYLRGGAERFRRFPGFEMSPAINAWPGRP